MQAILRPFTAFFFLICSVSGIAQDGSNNDSIKVKAAVVDTPYGKSRVYYSLRKRFYKDENDTLSIDKKGFTVKPSINVGVGYRIRRRGVNKDPFAYEHSLIAYYAINRGSFYVEYKSLWNQIIGNWNLGLTARADMPNSVFFFGIGNETEKLEDKKNRYYRMFSREFFGSVSINRFINKVHYIDLSPYYQTVDILENEEKFVTSTGSPVSGDDFKQKHFAGGVASYGYRKTDNDLTPTRGISFAASASYTLNTTDTERNFARYTSSFAFYLPLLKTVTLASRIGGATLQGDPEFYQLNRLGGNINLRGFRRERFYGKHSLYNNNELRWLAPTHNRFFDGKLGLLFFVDGGRVWQPGEASDTWHVGYGGGPLIQIFNQLLINGSYGFSKEDRVLHLRLGFLF